MDAVKVIMAWSPWVPHLACMTSPWLILVGIPVDGPPLWILTTTHGTSAITAYPIASCFKEKPGPLVAVIDFNPVNEAPITAHIEAISSSIWMNLPPFWGSLRASVSAISVEGVMGYPAKNSRPA